MYVVTLPDDLIARNARIRAALPAAPGALPQTLAQALVVTGGISLSKLKGTLYYGVNKVEADLAPGPGNTVTASFDFEIPSIDATTFKALRGQIAGRPDLGVTEAQIAAAAGLGPPPPGANRMAAYAADLFSMAILGPPSVTEGARAFTAKALMRPAARPLLQALRLLPVVTLRFSGKLSADGIDPATRKVGAYIPVTSIVFDDKLTIPFAGYSDNVILDNPAGGTLRLSAKPSLWATAR